MEVIQNPDQARRFVMSSRTEGELLGFALTGQAVKERMPLTKQLPAIL